MCDRVGNGACRQNTSKRHRPPNGVNIVSIRADRCFLAAGHWRKLRRKTNGTDLRDRERAPPRRNGYFVLFAHATTSLLRAIRRVRQTPAVAVPRRTCPSPVAIFGRRADGLEPVPTFFFQLTTRVGMFGNPGGAGENSAGVLRNHGVPLALTSRRRKCARPPQQCAAITIRADPRCLFERPSVTGSKPRSSVRSTTARARHSDAGSVAGGRRTRVQTRVGLSHTEWAGVPRRSRSPRHTRTRSTGAARCLEGPWFDSTSLDGRPLPAHQNSTRQIAADGQTARPVVATRPTGPVCPHIAVHGRIPRRRTCASPRFVVQTAPPDSVGLVSPSLNSATRNSQIKCALLATCEFTAEKRVPRAGSSNFTTWAGTEPKSRRVWPGCRRRLRCRQQ